MFTRLKRVSFSAASDDPDMVGTRMMLEHATTEGWMAIGGESVVEASE